MNIFKIQQMTERDTNLQTGTKQPCFIHDVSTSILFHGSPIKINDRYMASETYFTEDIEIAKEYGKFDENRAKANGYQPFPFQYGNKNGLIPGFIEALSFMNYGDKIVAFIPSKLGYGERGAGNVIPPNANIVFEIELIEAPAK
jgi:hypothetical protein